MKKLVLSLILAILSGISAFAANNYDFSAVCESGQTLYYTIKSSTSPCTVEIVPPYSSGYSTYPTGNLTIPTTVTYSGITYSVVSIGDRAFYNCSGLTEVTIPNSVTSIGDGAFYNCSGLTRPVYNANCFAYFPCGYATEYTIPSGIQQIAGSAFAECSGLTSVTIPNSVTNIGSYAFLGCSGLTRPVYNANCFAYFPCGYATEYTIPSGIQQIAGGAFAFCGVTSVTIPNSVTSIGDDAFYGCSGLTRPVYNANCFAYFPCGYATVYTIPNGIQQIAGTAFSGCSSLTSITIPSSVTSIGDYAFSGCRGLTSVTVPNSVTSIGNSAFSGCSGLTSVTIGSGVSSIGNYAFNDCTGLTNVNFNATSCTTMGDFYNPVFNYCNANATINISEGVTRIPAFAFYGLIGNGTLTIPNSVTGIGMGAFYECRGLTSVTIPNSVTNIGNFAFYGCSGLTRTIYTGSIAQWCGITFGNYAAQPLCSAHNLYINSSLVSNLVIPNTVEEIKAYAFYGATCLTSVNIPSTITGIGSYAFYSCSGLTGTLTIPSSVTSIGNGTFSGCSGLTGTLTIPSAVTSIGNSAFYGCSGLTSVTIPNSVTSIGNSAFYNCSGLTTVNFNATNCTTMGSSSYPVFQNCNANATINIGEGVTTIPDYAFKGLLGNGIMIIPSSVTGIGNSAFSGCSGMTGALTIPNSVTSIGESAFYGCGGLSGTLTVPNSVTSIGNSAFSSCNGLTTLNFNAENCTDGSYLFDSNNILSKITIGENVATIPNNAFQYCTSLDSIISAAPNPPVIYASTFDSQLSLNTPVVVPCGMVEAYEDADFWYNFRHIQQRADCGATYTITVMSSNSAWGTVSGGGTYMAGETATLTATPNSGYSFSNWSDGSTENPHQITVTQNDTYIATFVQGGSSNPTVYNSIETTACGNYTWNNQTYTESGEYQQTFTAANSADSIVTLTLTINPAPQPQITLYGELDACNPSSVAFATEQYQSYQWSNGATTMITSTSIPGYYYVEVTGENGCTGISEQVCIGVSNAITEAPQISVVGMNSENRNVVAWSALDNENVNSYRIYRENNVANVYEPMATVEASQTTWTDETADPSARAYRYKVTAVDECGGESPMSDYHKTMHLTINQGIGSTWNLIWSHYEGFNFGTYRIYRGTSPSNMTMIGEVPSNLNSYTDNTATDNTGFYYQVEVVRNNRSRDAEISSRSNIVDNGIFPEYTITVMSANPNRGTVTGGGTYPEGTVITIEATALDGFVFASWSDENTENPRQITVTGNATYIASFDEVSTVPEYTITVMSANPNRGTVTGGGTYPEGTIVRIEANALDGFVFTSWSDDNTDNPRYITVTENATYIASFDPATGIEENASLEISLFPNPANDILNISSSETISEIEIVNVMGQVVRRIEVNSENAVCDVEELTSGVYMVRIRTASATLSQRKFVKE